MSAITSGLSNCAKSAKHGITWLASRLLPLLILGLGLGACSMTNSAKLLETGTTGCHSDLGAYFLPRDVLHVEVRRTNPVQPSETTPASVAARQKPEHEIALIEVRTVPDRSRGFCLDYLGSRASNDYLEAKRIGGVLVRIGTSNRAYAEGLPEWTKSGTDIDSEDITSPVIAKKLIEGAFESFNPTIRPSQPGQRETYKDVDQPWALSQDEIAKREQQQQLFCQSTDSVIATQRTEALKIAPGLCDDKPATEPRAAPRRPYFSTETPSKRDSAKAFLDKDLRENALMRRLVYVRKLKIGTKEIDYVPSGARIKDTPASPIVLTPTELATLEDTKKRRELQHYELWQTDTAFSADFDPSRPAEAAVNNSGLRDFGYCILLNDGTLDLRHRDAYCDDPLGFASRKGWHAKSPDRFEGYLNHADGILYRPRLNYTLYVFKKKDRKQPGGWRLEAQHVVSLSNLSPMISVGIKRTLMASRNTIVEFDRGALVNIAIKKDSELLYGLDVPLALVKRVGELPTNIVKLRIRNTDALTQLSLKQKELLEAEKAHNEALARLQQAKTGTDLQEVLNVPGAKPQ